ncbi:pyrroloquinoline quinone precursor peptide PqqA [Streptomyces violaceusniger]|uniref:Coenzyme PQQ synthesis protein A n=1 Tax=Streptomyces violaceusniger (strain Tu 4113) TaxID=653045 RepID=G2NZD9_STRV4|nr:pyrroloquinoline quinone precursor peptide PqqA [Streptomyces violaceusniger]AEM83408.1 coenzyme PQQ biosynthesis protein A [Streptomyces violaceusniger Tu 4113]
MNDTTPHTAPDATDRTRTDAAETAWQTPDYVVVETALEVTAYSLNAR